MTPRRGVPAIAKRTTTKSGLDLRRLSLSFGALDMPKGFMNSNLTIATALVIQTARARTTQALIEAGFRELGLEVIDGVPIARWMELRHAEEFDKVLLEMGDRGPGADEAVQACLAVALREVKKSGAA